MRFDAQSFTEAFGKENQDFSFHGHLGPTNFFAAIADGVGGHFGGQLASHIAIETARDELAKDPNRNFFDVFSLICKKIKEKSFENPQYAEMATTLTILLANNSSVRYAHVGDSRIYHLSNYSA